MSLAETEVTSPPLFSLQRAAKLKAVFLENSVMATRNNAALAKQWQQEFELTPPELRPLLLKLAHSFRQSLTEDEDAELTPADALRQALREVKEGKTRPLEGLWERVGL